MEQRIKNVINSLDKFREVDFIKDEKISEIDSYLVQLRENENNIWKDNINFDSRADILITYDNKQINIYAKISDKFVEKDLQDLIDKLYEEFSIQNRFSNRSSIVRFDTLNL